MEVVCPTIGVLANASTLGKELIDLYQTLANARQDVGDRITQIRSHWIRTEAQLEFINRTWTSFSEAHQALLIDILGKLLGRLKTASEKVRGMLRKPKALGKDEDREPAVKRWKYLFLKSHLDDTIKSLDKWQGTFDPAWFLISKVGSALIDAELQRQDGTGKTEANATRKKASRVRQAVRGSTVHGVNVLLPSNGLDDARMETIPHCSALYVRRPGRNEQYIVDSVPYVAGSYAGDLEKDIRALATKLHCADPSTFSVLKCKGFVKAKDGNGIRLRSFEVVFDVPSPSPPRTLRSCLASRTAHTLTERMELAKQMARSVSYVHTLDFVHKNIRPENFIGFGDTQLGSYFLIGFGDVRSADGKTYYRGDVDWHRNLYRHPERQGLNPEERYVMQHDIYSLGVCLLEVGLWNTFVLYGDDGKVKAPNTSLFGLSIEQLRRKKPAAIKEMLVEMAKRSLPARVGEMYMEVVVNCLTCLDEDNVDFGDRSEFDDVDDVAVGVRFIEKILLALNNITV